MALFSEIIAIIDFGSQYTQLIARRLRELGAYSEIISPDIALRADMKKRIRGIVLSGGPGSIVDEKEKNKIKEILKLNVPILGICYGLQLIADIFNGKVEKGLAGEFGLADLKIIGHSQLFQDTPESQSVWMSHYDIVKEAPPGFEITAKTNHSPVASFESREKKIFAVQFHPEVYHTKYGKKILQNYLKTCNLSHKYDIDQTLIDGIIREIREKTRDKKVVAGISGGIDSTVLAKILDEAIGPNFYGIFVNNGLLRKNEEQEVQQNLQKIITKGKIIYVDASAQFLNKLHGITDPEQKRKIIGHTFIDVFSNVAKNIENVHFLAQGTLYPDVIESGGGHFGKAAKIKSHHNVGGLPEKLGFELIEPLKYFFKDEVREIAKILNIPQHIIERHPFPGPGLAVRILGPITEKKLDILREADYIFIDELKRSGLYQKVWQAFCVFLPVKTVGVKGDQRSYENAIVLRAVNSVDGMTADSCELPLDFLKKTTNRILNEVEGVNRVVYDLTSKPPGTIEWE